MKTSHRSLLALAGAACVGALTAAPALAAPSSADQQWMVAAHQSNLAEIAAGRSAQAHATTATVRQLGAEWIADHTRLDSSLTAAARQSGVTLPSTPTAAQQQDLAGVEAHSGAAYDSAWLAEELPGHEMARSAGQRELSDGSDATALQLDRSAAPVIQKHIDQLVAAQRAGGSPSSVPAGTGGQAATSSSAALGWTLGGAGVLVLAATGTTAVRRRRRTA